jgi:dipeptidyl aminopeptidase/acylaminoacyl peptidase
MLRLAGLTLILAALLAMAMSCGMALGRSEEPFAPWITFQTDRDRNSEIYRMRPDGSDQQNLTNHPAHDHKQRFSPDGRWIIFISDRDGDPEIYRMRPDGSQPQNLTQNAATDEDPQWSPDGQWIAFTSVQSENRDIYRMRADGSQQQILTQNPRDDANPQWSPDGQWIAFASLQEGYYDIFKMRADGSEQQNLTSSIPTAYNPHWSEDGQWIVFNTQDNGHHGIVRIHADGISSRYNCKLIITKFFACTQMARSGKISPTTQLSISVPNGQQITSGLCFRQIERAMMISTACTPMVPANSVSRTLSAGTPSHGGKAYTPSHFTRFSHSASRGF